VGGDRPHIWQLDLHTELSKITAVDMPAGASADGSCSVYDVLSRCFVCWRISGEGVRSFCMRNQVIGCASLAAIDYMCRCKQCMFVRRTQSLYTLSTMYVPVHRRHGGDINAQLLYAESSHSVCTL
jgi:hypothetical protein